MERIDQLYQCGNTFRPLVFCPKQPIDLFLCIMGGAATLQPIAEEGEEFLVGKQTGDLVIVESREADIIIEEERFGIDIHIGLPTKEIVGVAMRRTGAIG